MPDNPFKIKENSIRDRKLANYGTNKNQGDNFLFLPNFSGWLGKSLKSKHILIFYSLLILLFSLLVFRVTFLQLVRGKHYLSIAENNRLKIIPLKAPRGIIYDRYGRKLVENVPRFTVYLNPRLIQSADQAILLANYLTNLLPNSRTEIATFLKDYKTISADYLLVTDIKYDLALELMIKSSDIAALQIAYEPQRHYVYDFGLAHVLGYIGRISPEEFSQLADYGINDLIGKNGIEKQYEEILKGQDGAVTTEVDALGREKDNVSQRPPRRGADLYLTIDLDMQEKLQGILTDITSQYDKPAAAGVVIDPNNGEILALVSDPSYDQNLFSSSLTSADYQAFLSDPGKPFFTRVTAGEYPAGSIFKMAVAAAALEEKLISENFTINSTGGIALGGRFFPDWKAGGHGLTNIYKALADSVNSFFYIVGGGDSNTPGLGVDNIVQYAKKYGFGQKTRIDLPGESEGFLPSRSWKEIHGDRWYQGDTYNLSIGQGALLVTPIQIAAYISALATNYSVTPHLLKYYTFEDQEFPGSRLSFERSPIIDQPNINIIQTGMRRSILNGTATIMQSIPKPVAGKTGTAQFNRNKDPHSWFAGYAPYPEADLALVIIVEEGGAQGLAIQAAHQLMSWYFRESVSLTGK
jgi:penicillin-binding protein 2